MPIDFTHSGVLSGVAIIVSDTGVYRSEESYERTMLYREWDPLDKGRIAKVDIRVDRSPVMSHARVSVWVPSAGWQFVTSANPTEFWNAMPGYTRGSTRHADRDTLNLGDELMDRLIETHI